MPSIDAARKDVPHVTEVRVRTELRANSVEEDL